MPPRPKLPSERSAMTGLEIAPTGHVLDRSEPLSLEKCGLRRSGMTDQTAGAFSLA